MSTQPYGLVPAGDRERELFAPGNGFAPPGFTPEECGQAAAKLEALCAARILAYTSGESTSVPVETAGAILSSIIYTLGRYFEQTGSWRDILTQPADQLLTRARHRLERDLSRGKMLWKAAAAVLPPWASAPCRETLGELGAFFARYDRLYMAHEVPCSVSYFLAMPPAESLQGLDYVETYLRRLAAESKLAGPFPAGDACRLLALAHGPAWQEMPQNQAEALVAQGLGAAMAGHPGSLRFSGQDRLCLLEMGPALWQAPAKNEAEGLPPALARGARALAAALGADEGGRTLLAHMARGLVPRLFAARGNGYAGVFFTLE